MKRKTKRSISDSLLVQFLQKETNDLENQLILDWISESEANREKFREVHEAWHAGRLKFYQSTVDVDEAWDFVRGQLEEKPEPKTKRFLKREVIWQIAASIAILLAIGFGSLWTSEHYQQPTASLISVESPSGEKSKVVLADGTHVWLNSETILKYDVSNPRKVKLIGEAFFDVVKDATHPFEVQTKSGMKVTVLGTKFNLRSFADEKTVETTLEEGKVLISGLNTGKTVELKPGQQAKYNIAEHAISVHNVLAEVYSLWKENELHFVDASFAELVPQIERWYGVQIELDPKISASDKFNMTIKTESLRELLKMMQLTSNFVYEINGEEVIIKAK